MGVPKCFTFPLCCFVSKLQRIKGDGGRKSRPISDFSFPVTIRGGMEEITEWIFKFDLGPNL